MKEEDWEILTKDGSHKKLSELEEGDFTPSPGLGCYNQVILNAIKDNMKRKEKANDKSVSNEQKGN